jgi:DNA-binding transcriptional MerR regulator
MPHERLTALPTGFGFGPPRRLGERRPAPGARATDARGRSLQSIGAIAREFGVSLRALRFYEDKGLLEPLRQGTTRLYSVDDRSRLSTILKGKALGFTLREIREMVREDEVANTHRSGAQGALGLSREQVRGQIAHLEGQKAEIEAALARLRGYERGDGA